MKRYAYLFSAFLVVLVIFSLSCGKDKKSPTGPSDSDEEAVITENTKVVDDEENITLDTLSEDSITYSFTGQAPDISKGDVLVSGEGNGYLRKVKSVTVEGDKVTVETEQAALTDVVEKGKIDTTITFDFSAQKAGQDTGILKLAKGVTVSKEGFDLSGVDLFSGNDLQVTITDGSILFKPDFDIALEIEGFSVEEFHAYVSGNIVLDFDVQATASKVVKNHDEITLIAYTNIAYQQIGPVPVIEVITLEFNAGFEADISAEGSIKTGFDHSTEVRVVAQYESGNWSPVWEKKVESTKHDTDYSGSADVYVMVYIRPKLSVKFYNVAGPYFDVMPYMEFDGDICGEYSWYYDLTGGIESNLGFDVSALGYGIANYSTELVAWEKVIASDFKELPVTYTLTGTILEDGSGLSGVSVNIKGGDVNETVTTTSDGSYTLTGLFNGTYTITPSMSGYTFNPSSTDVTISGADATVSDITATQSGGGESYDITFVSIPGGTFQMGDVEGGGSSTAKPVHTVTLSSFEMSIYEVTNAQYAKYLNSALASGDIEVKERVQGTLVFNDVVGVLVFRDWEFINLAGYALSRPDNDCKIVYSNGSFNVKSGYENWPVAWVSWYGAKAFAEFYGFDLPTEAEWEYACRGGQQYMYGTDDGTISSSNANYYYYVGHTTDVGSYPANPFGLYDMCGNVWELCNDWYDANYYSSSPSTDPTGPTSGSRRVSRGGSSGYDKYSCRSSHRSSIRPDDMYIFHGFRVVSR